MLADDFPGSSKADFRKLELVKLANEVGLLSGVVHRLTTTAHRDSASPAGTPSQDLSHRSLGLL
jgi:hypothetical protein